MDLGWRCFCIISPSPGPPLPQVLCKAPGQVPVDHEVQPEAGLTQRHWADLLPDSTAWLCRSIGALPPQGTGHGPPDPCKSPLKPTEHPRLHLGPCVLGERWPWYERLPHFWEPESAEAQWQATVKVEGLQHLGAVASGPALRFSESKFTVDEVETSMTAFENIESSFYIKNSFFLSGFLWLSHLCPLVVMLTRCVCVGFSVRPPPQCLFHCSELCPPFLFRSLTHRRCHPSSWTRENMLPQSTRVEHFRQPPLTLTHLQPPRLSAWLRSDEPQTHTAPRPVILPSGLSRQTWKLISCVEQVASLVLF